MPGGVAGLFCCVLAAVPVGAVTARLWDSRHRGVPGWTVLTSAIRPLTLGLSQVCVVFGADTGGLCSRFSAVRFPLGRARTPGVNRWRLSTETLASGRSPVSAELCTASVDPRVFPIVVLCPGSTFGLHFSMWHPWDLPLERRQQQQQQQQ